MSGRDEIEAILEDLNPEALFADGLDDALIGIAGRAGWSRLRCTTGIDAWRSWSVKTG